MKTITKNNVSDYVDGLIDIAKDIKADKITILTGSNGSGKSFIRKLLQPKTKSGKEITVASISMERRAGLNYMGAMNAFMRDAEWNPTSLESFHQIEGLLSQSDRYLVFDEPEVGMGEEAILGLVHMLNEELKKKINEKQIRGALIVTHSRSIVQHLNHDKFIYLDNPDMTTVEWINRDIKPLHLNKLSEKSGIVFKEIQDRINEKKKENK